MPYRRMGLVLGLRFNPLEIGSTLQMEEGERRDSRGETVEFQSPRNRVNTSNAKWRI